MADISMCSNNLCPNKETCYRHEATPNPLWQSYMHFTFKSDGSCEHYLDIGEYGEKGYKKETRPKDSGQASG